MSFERYEILKEQCSICKSCGTNKDDCLDCEKRMYIKNFENQNEEDSNDLA